MLQRAAISLAGSIKAGVLTLVRATEIATEYGYDELILIPFLTSDPPGGGYY
jgi:hypothetical protein